MATKEWREKNIERLREYRRAWYRRNAVRVRKKESARMRKIRQWFREYKRTQKCGRCPENHPACIHFHHRDPRTKDLSLSEALQNGWSLERIKKELEKCDPLCGNCHAKLHWRGEGPATEEVSKTF